MKFQPGQSGNPAGRPPGSLNKKTIAAQDAFEAHAEEGVASIVEHAKNGKGAAMRVCMERWVPAGRNRRLAINLPAIKTADDAEAALAIVLAELAAGKLAIHEVSSLLVAIERMVRLAERIEKMRQAEREREAEIAREATVPATAATAKSADASGARLYSPVNPQTATPIERAGARANQPAHPASGEAVPQARAA